MVDVYPSLILGMAKEFCDVQGSATTAGGQKLALIVSEIRQASIVIGYANEIRYGNVQCIGVVPLPGQLLHKGKQPVLRGGAPLRPVTDQIVIQVRLLSAAIALVYPIAQVGFPVT